jgi:DNA-binding sugar fermentation-stimulating protein
MIIEGEKLSGTFISRPNRFLALSFEPNSTTDPKFAETLRQAITRGVEAYAYTVDFTQDRVTLLKSIPINVQGS